MAEKYDGLQAYCVIKSNNKDSVTTRTATMTMSGIVSGPFVFERIGDTNNLVLVEYNPTNDPDIASIKSIKVPDSVDGMPVTEIGKSPLAEDEQGVFEGNTTITSIELPNGITKIGERAFKGCSNLSTMTTY